MDINVFKPSHKLLEECIECYYVLKRTKEDNEISYITFPSLFTIVSLSLETLMIRGKGKEKTIIIRGNENELDSSIVSRFETPLMFQYKEEVVEITIYFKPLGINAFLEKELHEYPDGSGFFPFDDWEEVLVGILKNTDDQLKIKHLEEYLLSKYKGFGHPFLFDLVQDLVNETQALFTMDALASKYVISTKNMRKHFKRHLCKTPQQFRKIAKFRSAIERHNRQTDSISMTELSYLLNYFDQSHLIKDFKSLSGYPPKFFFKNLRSLESGMINWIFL